MKGRGISCEQLQNGKQVSRVAVWQTLQLPEPHGMVQDTRRGPPNDQDGHLAPVGATTASGLEQSGTIPNRTGPQ